MNRDEKSAFDAMLAEIGDSDEDDAPPTNAAVKPGARNAYGNPHMMQSDAKGGMNRESSYRGNQGYKQDSGSAQASSGTSSQTRNKMSKEEQEIENFGVAYQQNPVDMQAEQLSITKRWLSRSVNRSERSSMKCFIERERQTFSMQTIYRCYLETNDSQGPATQPTNTARFMMSAKKIVGKKTSYYLISLDHNPSDDRGSELVLGKIRGNSVGSKYLITDAGLAPEKTVAPSMLRKEYGVVTFQFDSGGPSHIDAWIPAVSSSGNPTVWQPDSEVNGLEAAVEELQANPPSSPHPGNIFRLVNKVPKWDDVHGGHVLNFQGRVTESSVKNFQLCCLDIDDNEDVILQFGRVSKHRFTMDLKFPLSPIQAFAICVTCLDGKIADRKGYEYIRRLGGGGTAGAAAGGAEGGDDNLMSADGKGGNSNSMAGSVSDGSMKGSSSISGMLREAMPSGQYLRDKFNRTFK